MAIGTLGYLPSLHVTAADEQDRAQVGRLARDVQEAAGRPAELAYVDQGYTGDTPTDAARRGRRRSRRRS